jgi:protein-tyrosine phosphatase
VIFVCLGNICRSPLAEGIARRVAEERGLDLRIDSAGTGDWHIGEPPCDHSVTVAQKHGIDISVLRARQVRKRDLELFDLVIALDAKNYSDLERMGAENLYKLGDFGFGGEDVPDPYFFPGYEGFDRVFEMVETCVTELFDTHFPDDRR